MQKLPTAAFGREVGGMRGRSVVFALASTLLLGCVSCSTSESAAPPEPSPTAEATVSPPPIIFLNLCMVKGYSLLGHLALP